MTGLASLRGVVLVQVADTVVFETCGGMADAQTGLANTHDTRFQLASVSKQFTAASILLLADRGVLSVHDIVGQWVAGCPQAWHSMTIHHLLTHTAGLGHWHDLPEIDLLARLEPAGAIAIFQRMPLRNAPGGGWYYSSPGYVLLAHIVECAAGRPYAAFLSGEIFGPLGMAATFAGNGAGQPRLAVGYASGAPARSSELDATGMGAGDVWSTTGDLARWDAAVAARTLLSAAAWETMLTRHAPVEVAAGESGPVTTDGYGYAWFTGSVSGLPVFYHQGDNAGFVSLNCWIPDLNARVIVLSNEETTSIEALAGEILATALAS